MARHVSEGGNAYDDFDKYIVSLSEELNKLRKFKNYMGRSGVMAEGLQGYMDVVYERIDTVKKTIEQLQKPTHYKTAFEGFEKPVLEEVPEEVSSNWIDQLTIRQFNEELKDVFPYIYKLVNEKTKAKELGPEDFIEEGMKTLKCKDCGDTLGNPTTDCPHDCQDPKGENWIMIDADNDGDMDMAVSNETMPDDFFAFENWADDVVENGLEDAPVDEMDDDLQDLDDMGFRGYKVLVNNEIKQYTCAALWLVSKV